MEMLSRQSEFRLSFPYREMLVFRPFGRLSLTSTKRREEQCVSSEQPRLPEPLQQGKMMLVEDAAQVAELQAMQNGRLDSESLQMMLRPTPILSRRKQLP